MTPDQARQFVANNHRAVMITRRAARGLQTSPVTVDIDSDGKMVISSRRPSTRVHRNHVGPVAPVGGSPSASTSCDDSGRSNLAERCNAAGHPPKRPGPRFEVPDAPL